ncbi:MAG: DegT/DnrJ/EryC1/StrS family aminotransferase [Phycisphaerae bacterium]|jgi:perosamine synthetase
MNIPFHKSDYGKPEYDAVKRVLKSGWLTQGEEVAKFEEEFAKYVGAKYAVAVSSCTMALTMALDAIPIGSPVEVPSLTFSASAMAIIQTRKEPYFVDVDDRYIGKFSSDGCAVVVHYSGIDASEYDCSLTIHDCAHRVERDMCKGMAGEFCFSFYPTKQIAGAEGGMICTTSETFANSYRTWRNHGRLPNSTEVVTTGYKGNMTDVQAALCRVQLAKLDETNARRAEIVAAYNDAFGLENTGLHLYPIQFGCEHTLEVDRLSSEAKQIFTDAALRDATRVCLLEDGIATSIHYPPLHLMPAYKPYTKSLPNTERICKRIVSLPLYPALTNKEVSYIIKTVRKYL